MQFGLEFLPGEFREAVKRENESFGLMDGGQSDCRGHNVLCFDGQNDDK